MITFNLTNEYGVYITITVNGQLKIRSFKKILKYHFSKEGEWPIFDLYDDNLFNDHSQLELFHRYSQTIYVKFYPEEPEEALIRYRNGDFKTSVSIRDNFHTFKKRLIRNFYIGKDVKICDAFGNEYNSYVPVQPIKDDLYLYIPIRDNQNNMTTWEIAELKVTNFKTKSKIGRMDIVTPYFSAWNVEALKFYINMLCGTNDKETTIFINNYQCDFEETIEFKNGIFEIRGNIKMNINKPYIKSLAIPLMNLNIHMAIITYGGRMSPTHCWSNFSLEQALNIWENTQN
jgi:hypothetical protein